jgi:hypothetical protein
MANQGQAAQPVRAAAVVPGRRRVPVSVLDVARLLMLCGALAAVGTMGSPPIHSRQAIPSLGLWLLGVSLLAFVPILRAGRFPPRPALVVAAVANNAVLRYSFALWN